MRVWIVLPLMLLAGAAAQDWDFVPGARLLLYDDFTDVRKGAAPPHWKVRGAGVALDLPGGLTPNIPQRPANFTVEQEFLVEKVDQGDPLWEGGPALKDIERAILQIAPGATIQDSLTLSGRLRKEHSSKLVQSGVFTASP